MVFPLSRTPDMFFDPELWELFVSYFDTPEIAYERIGYPPELVGYHYEDYEKRSSLPKERWQEIEEAWALGRELLLGLQQKFLSEELLATGVPRGYASPTREPIPASDWLKLWPNFAGNWAMSTNGRFDEIEVSWHPKDKNVQLKERCEAFLLKRKQDGESHRKILIHQAAKYLGESVPVRIFDAAYTTVFQKKRGRPRVSR